MPFRSVAVLNAAGRIIQVASKFVPDDMPLHDAFPDSRQWIEVNVSAGGNGGKLLCLTKKWNGTALVDVPASELNEHETRMLAKLKRGPAMSAAEPDHSGNSPADLARRKAAKPLPSKPKALPPPEAPPRPAPQPQAFGPPEAPG